MRQIIFTISLALINLTAWSQSYSFEHFTRPYSNITNGTSLNVGKSWDKFTPLFTIQPGFNFELFGQGTDELEVSCVGSVGSVGINGTCAGGGTATYIAAFVGDLIDRGYQVGNSMSNISYIVEGTFGNRICKIEWNNVGFANGGKNSSNVFVDHINFQVWLYEGTNVVELHYGPNSVTEPELAYAGKSGSVVGIVGGFDCSNGQMFNLPSQTLKGSPSSPNPITMKSIFNISSLNESIGANQVYRFTPKNK